MIITLLSSAINMSMTFLYGAIGETLTEKSGHLNLGTPGVMCMGMVGGSLGVTWYLKSIPDTSQINGFLLIASAILMCLLLAGAMGVLYCFLTVTLRANQNITGLALTTFGVGILSYSGENIDKTGYAIASGSFKNFFPFADKLGAFGTLFFSYGFLAYLAIAIAIVMAIVLRRTRVGLHLRAVGENPATADAAGINVTAYRYGATILGCAIAGLGGLFYLMDYLKGSWEYALEGLGWLAVALVIFSIWKPDFAILGSILFGILYILPNYVSFASDNRILSTALNEVVKMLPYLVTILVLILTSLRKKRENQPPAGLGLNYFREDR